MNLFSAQGQSQVTIEKTLLTDLVRTAEKLQADNADLKVIDANQKIIIEYQGVRIVELEDTLDMMKVQVDNIKVAYADLVEKKKAGNFWVWLKGIVVGIGATATAILLL